MWAYLPDILILLAGLTAVGLWLRSWLRRRAIVRLPGVIIADRELVERYRSCGLTDAEIYAVFLDPWETWALVMRRLREEAAEKLAAAYQRYYSLEEAAKPRERESLAYQLADLASKLAGGGRE